MNTARPTGLNDCLPREVRARRACQDALQQVLSSFGYQEVEPPVLEFADLFLERSAAAQGMRLFTLEQGGRRLSLRPDFTTSVGRLFVEHGQGWPRPIRLQFAGPVFRLETPQRGRFRQFTLVGGELLGAEGPLADAEVVALACTALQAVGVRDFRVEIGQAGLVQAMLRGLGLSQRGQQFVLRHMESLRKPHLGRAHVDRLLDVLYPARPAPAGGVGGSETLNGPLADMLEDTLAAQGGFLGSRTAEEVAGRLVEKRRVSGERQVIEMALDAVESLGRLAGPYPQALEEVVWLFRSRGWEGGLLADLRETLDLVVAHGVPEEVLWLDLGIGRGVHTYTGLVFEIHRSARSRGDSQLCGGGRYDNLLGDLGSRQPVAAAGFAIGLERVLDALGDGRSEPADEPLPADVMVIPVEAEDAPCAAGLAQRLRRGASLRVELQVKEHLGLGPGLSLANRRGIPVVVIVGGRERTAGRAVVRQMDRRRQREVPMEDVLRVVLQALEGEARVRRNDEPGR